jgi:hypothetical protein
MGVLFLAFHDVSVGYDRFEYRAWWALVLVDGDSGHSLPCDSIEHVRRKRDKFCAVAPDWNCTASDDS